MFLDVRTDAGIGQGDNHIALTLLATLEVDVFDAPPRTGVVLDRLRCGQARGRRGRRRGSGNRTRCCRSRGGIAHQHIEVTAIHAGAVGHERGQVDDQSSAILGFHHGHAAGITHAQFPILRAQFVGHARKIQGYAGWLLDGIATRRGHWLVEGQLEFDPVPRQCRDIQPLQVRRQQRR
ncbi:hypothetical protein D9M71_131540 [compost metagenome]